LAIGELVAQEKTQGLHGKQLAQALAEALKRMRRERAGGREAIAAETHHGLSGVYEHRRLALKNG
jgi:hypothetical protein